MRLRTLRYILVGLLAVAVALTGCGRGEELDPTTQAVRQAVLDYNDALARAFWMRDLNELVGVATDEQIVEETYIAALLDSEGSVMRASLVSIEFGDVVVYAEDDVSITTTEVWDYDYVSLETSETVRSERGVEYQLRYDLVLENGQWLVYTVDAFDLTPSTEEATP